MKIIKKHLIYIILICSLLGNICFYIGKRKAEQKVTSTIEELAEKEKEYETMAYDLTKSGEEKSDEKAMFAEVAAADYLEVSRFMTSIHSATLDRLVNTYYLYDDTDDAYPKLIDTAMISTADGEEDWLYEVINSLKEIGEENRKIDVFLDDIKQHFGNGITESEQMEDNVDNAGSQLETYIASKEKQMSEWTFYNSRYFISH
ncbi:MAG: hypothetical protein NC231_10410 [Bacillus sp. (in: Bacteria)]|nr:hypothetical protein [Bacillus sp. (in: firmicutes)]MCM1427513.1 hypothetical protein [Eubacterium sp.]